jgi:type IV secretory pathway VirB10-like protein
MSTAKQRLPEKKTGSRWISLQTILMGSAVLLLLLVGLLWSGIFKSQNSPVNQQHPNSTTGHSDSSSTALIGKAPTPAAPGESPSPSVPPASAANKTPPPAVQASQADQLLQQQQAQELAKKQAELDAMAAQQQKLAAEQAAKQQELAQAQQQLQIQKKQEEAQQAAALRKEQETVPAKPAYVGPTSGDIVWQGSVTGNALVTITGNTCDTGTLISGGLPGVPVIVQPTDTKHIRLAATPAPSNSYQRLVFGVSGKGTVQVVLHWSRS